MLVWKRSIVNAMIVERLDGGIFHLEVGEIEVDCIVDIVCLSYTLILINYYCSY